MHALREHSARGGDALLCAFLAAVAIHGNEFAQAKSPTKHRNMHQRSLKKRGRASGDIWNERRRIEIRDMVCHEDAGGFLSEPVRGP